MFVNRFLWPPPPPGIDSSGAYCFTDVHLSYCLSVSLLKTYPVNLTFSYYFHTIQVPMLIFGMKVHLINMYLLVSRSSVKVKVEYQGYISQKIAISGALVFHKHILFNSNTFFFFFFFFLGGGGNLVKFIDLQTTN